MNVVIYANCQGLGIGRILPVLSQTFAASKITIYENYKLIADSTNCDRLIASVGEADLFLYQPVGADHGVLSTSNIGESIMNYVRPTAQCLSFPYLYNLGPWPLYREGDNISNTTSIHKYFDTYTSIDKVLEDYRRGRLYFNIKERIKDSVQTLRMREQCTDVKVADFIEDNIFSSELFFTQNHPSTEVFIFVICQMLDRIGQSVRNLNNISSSRLDANFAGLPGRYPIDRYCIDEGGVCYTSTVDADACNFYEGLIRSCYDSWKLDR